MTADLKKQFQLLQEQQKRKLLRRKELEAEEITRNSLAGNRPTGTNLGPFDVGDDLSLQITGEPEDLLFDTDIEDQKEIIRELRDENGRLYKLLGEKEEEMKLLKRRWQNEKQELTGQKIGSENVAQKIIDLSKKNRDLSAELESSKTKNRKLQNDNLRLENELKKNQSKLKERALPDTKGPDLTNETKIADLEGKLNNVMSKMTDYRNQVETQKRELKIAQKVLSKEVGEGVDIQSLLNSTSNWRGRQQQIVTLQSKVADLQQQIAQSARPISSALTNNSVMSSMSYQSPLASIHDERIRSTIKKIEQERKESQTKVQNELEVLQKENTRLKEKHDAAKIRNQILSQELKGIKSQVSILIEKGKHDDDLVSALMREQQHLKNMNEKLVKENNNSESSPGNRVVKATQDSQKNNELKKQIEEQEKKVQDLEEEIERLKAAKRNDKHLENIVKNPSIDLKDKSLTQERLNKSKPSMIPTPPSSAERRNGYRRRRPSSVISEDVSTLRQQIQEKKSLLQAAEVERDRLIGLVEVLHGRINEATEKCIVADKKISELSRTNVKVEKQIERLKSETNSHKGIGPYLKNRPVSRARRKERTVEEMYEEIDELQARLEIQTDENDALKEALNSTLKAKNDDMKIYQEMVEQTKMIFLQGLKQLKETQNKS